MKLSDAMRLSTDCGLSDNRQKQLNFCGTFAHPLGYSKEGLYVHPTIKAN